MPPAPVGALVLAAGLCRRFGSAKLLAVWKGRPIVSFVLDEIAAARDAGFITTGVVVHRPDDLETPRMARERGLEPHLNPRPASGMASSLRLGLNALSAPRWQPMEGALVVMADQPLLRREVIEALVQAFRPSMDLVRPRYSGDPDVPGHPVIVHRRLWDRARSLTGDQGFRVLAEWNNVRLGSIAVEGANPDVDTPEDLARLDETAGPRMKQDLAQLVIFAGWAMLLWRYAPFRSLLRATPRLQAAAIGALLLGWTVTQVARFPNEFFPLISVHMYGRYSPRPAARGVRIVGESCAGERRTIDLRPLMTRPGVGGRVQQEVYNLANARSAADTARRLSLLNETLVALGRLYNGRYQERPLCAMGLEIIMVPVTDDGPGPFPVPDWCTVWTFADRRLVHSEATPESLAILRIWIFGVWTILAVLDPLPVLAAFPTALFSPIGVIGLIPPPVLDAVLSPPVLQAFKAVLVLACLAATIGLATRFSTVLAVLLIIFWQSLVRAPLGYANHAEVTLILAAVVLAVSPSGAALAVWPARARTPSAAACSSRWSRCSVSPACCTCSSAPSG